jgi:hypothetical protein
MHAKAKTVSLACLCVVCLGGCVVTPVGFILTTVLPHIINGKGLPEDAADLVTGKDCRVVEGVVRKNRQICETRGSSETHDFKGLAGLFEDQAPRHVADDRSALSEGTPK